MADSVGEEETTRARIVEWHEARFPAAQMEHVALKVCEEAGEVAKAINGVAGADSATGIGDVGGEAADVMIALSVLLGRWFPEIDLDVEVEQKLAVLTDPNSGHPAASRGEVS